MDVHTVEVPAGSPVDVTTCPECEHSHIHLRVGGVHVHVTCAKCGFVQSYTEAPILIGTIASGVTISTVMVGTEDE